MLLDVHVMEQGKFTTPNSQVARVIMGSTYILLMIYLCLLRSNEREKQKKEWNKDFLALMVLEKFTKN